MSDCLNSLAIMTVQSKIGVFTEADVLWYFGDEGIKRSKYSMRWDPDGITDLSAKEKLRWSKVCEWLDDYFRRNPARRVPQSEGRNLSSLLRELEIDMTSRIAANISNFPGGLFDGSISSPKPNRTRWTIRTPWFICYYHKEFLLILVILSLVYGGIHLAILDFAFASKTERSLWKVACIDIMATVPFQFLFDLGRFSVVMTILLERPSARKMDIASYFFFFFFFLSNCLTNALLVLYVLSRIYIVAESFISLRHVPIGVYAAVPWVQSIPHV